jgi:ferredoxin-type protein NapH
LGSNIKRRIIQTASAVVTNGYFKGFINGKIFTGKSKQFCVPGLNCYSCPGALGACPIGSMQSVIGSIRYNFSFYVLGLVSLFGVIFGRLICGFLCPFGFLQELLHKIPVPKLKIKPKINNILKYLKYVILVLFVIILPLKTALSNDLGISDPYFCKYICPAGTLEGGIPLVLLNGNLRSAVGLLYAWKVLVLLVVIILSTTIYRFFCRYLCPLGAFYSLFNRISFYSIKVDKSRCVGCNACTKACKLGITPHKTPNSGECIRCGECVNACKCKAMAKGFRNKTSEIKCESVNTNIQE